MPTTRLSTWSAVCAATLAATLIGAARSPAAPPEMPLTKPATKITATAATLHGQLNPGTGSEKLKYDFSYQIGASCTEGAVAPEPPAEAEGNHKEVSVAVTGLEPSIQYAFCLVARNALEETELTAALPASFTTAGARPQVTAERIKTESLTPFDAALEAEINAENQATTYHFEYATSPTLTGARSIGAGTLPGSFGDQAAGPADLGAALTPGTTYFYRVVAANATGTTKGPTQELTTPKLEQPLVVEGSQAAANLTQTTAALSAAINPEFQETRCKAFQYVDDAGFKASAYAAALEAPCNPEALGSGSSPVATSTSLTGLAANTTYHFRVLAENPSGLSQGADQVFLTLPNPPVVATGEAVAITATSGTITGTVNPDGEGTPAETTYFFQWGVTQSYGRQTPQEPGNVGQGTTPVSETAALAGLEPGRVYHYRIVATNDATGAPQTVYGEDRTLETLPTPPIVTTVGVSNVGETGATLTATIDARGLPTRYELQLGTAQAALLAKAVGNTTGAGAVSLPLTSLNPGTRYYYRLIVSNPNGTAQPLPEGAFTTAAAPGAASPLTQPPAAPLLSTPAIAFPNESRPGGAVLGARNTRPSAAQKLATALRSCRKKPHRQRPKCERDARRRFRSARKHTNLKRLQHPQ